MVRSKIRLLSFTAFILLVVFFVFLGYFFIVENFGIKEQIGGVFLLGVGVYVIYFYLKLTPIIEVSNSTVSVLNFFKRERYLTSEIKQVRLKQVRGYEGMVIEFSNGEKIAFIDSMYANSSVVKKALEKYINLKDKKGNVHKRVKNKEVRGTYFNISFFLLLITFFLFLKVFIDGLFIVSLIFLIMSYLITRLLYYFSIENNQLVIKNHILFWFRKEYSLENIIFLRVEYINTHRFCIEGLRVLKRDYKSKRYLSSPMRDKDWERLFNGLIKNK